ncbi:hypothetical protein Ct61P_06404 [Colletotrichum tofieldiae]|nr:hypothetical protein Ct61P_06404 [Colletotrichum tofieldiae]
MYEEEIALANEVEASEQPVLGEEPLGVELMPPQDKCQKNTLNSEQFEAVDTAALPIEFVLSSRHLILASRYFCAKLKGPWNQYRLYRI